MPGTASDKHEGQHAEVLADIVLPDQDGNQTRLGDLWKDGPVALVWLRHYG